MLNELGPAMAHKLTGFVIHRAMGRLPEKCEQLVFFNAGMLRTMIHHLESVTLCPEEIIFQAGEAIDKLVFVIQGRVSVYLSAPQVLDKKSALERGYTDKNMENNRALRALENNSACATEATSLVLEDPGLLLPNRSFGALAKETIACKSVCITWVCTESIYQHLLHFQPRIGGVFSTFEEMLQNKISLVNFRDFLEMRGNAHYLEFILAVQDYRKRATNEATRTKKSTAILERFFNENSDDNLGVPVDVLEKVRAGHSSGSNTHFDGTYSDILNNLKNRDLHDFQRSPKFKKTIRELHVQRRTKMSLQTI